MLKTLFLKTLQSNQTVENKILNTEDKIWKMKEFENVQLRNQKNKRKHVLKILAINNK